mmetsp:Transcript_18625/g.46694  ORF Transcript_18625/g.46694 Transcript_18625/m.46694 type:complete len:95 (+) Transcript_18625:725-1009(+)
MGFALSNERIRSVLTKLKQCRTEEERVDYHTVLGALAPTCAAARNSEGMIRAVSARLGIERGARFVKGEKRPTAQCLCEQIDRITDGIVGDQCW